MERFVKLITASMWTMEDRTRDIYAPIVNRFITFCHDHGYYHADIVPTVMEYLGFPEGILETVGEVFLSSLPEIWESPKISRNIYNAVQLTVYTLEDRNKAPDSCDIAWCASSVSIRVGMLRFCDAHGFAAFLQKCRHCGLGEISRAIITLSCVDRTDFNHGEVMMNDFSMMAIFTLLGPRFVAELYALRAYEELVGVSDLLLLGHRNHLIAECPPPMEVHTEVPIDVPMEVHTEVHTEAPINIPIEVHTEVHTEAPINIPTGVSAWGSVDIDTDTGAGTWASGSEWEAPDWSDLPSHGHDTEDGVGNMEGCDDSSEPYEWHRDEDGTPLDPSVTLLRRLEYKMGTITNSLNNLLINAERQFSEELALSGRYFSGEYWEYTRGIESKRMRPQSMTGQVVDISTHGLRKP